MEIINNMTLKVSASEFLIALEKQTKEYDLERINIVNKILENISLDKHPFRMPTAPNDPIVSGNPKITTLIVADQIDLRGKLISTPIAIYGVYFQGQVDLSDTTIEGSLDLTGCVFSAKLKLNDAKISGSLKLERISAKSVELVNCIIGGRISLSGSGIQDSIKLQGAKVGGRIDLTAVSAKKILMRGMNIQGDVRIGCGKEGEKELSRVGLIDGSYSTIDEHLVIIGVGWKNNLSSTGGFKYSEKEPYIENHEDWGSYNLLGPNLVFDGCTINGSLQLLPYVGNSSDILDFNTNMPTVRKDTTIVWSVVCGLRINNAIIGGDFNIYGVYISEQGVYANNAHVKGSITFATCGIRLFDKKDNNYFYTYLYREVSVNGFQNSISFKNIYVNGDIFIRGVITNSSVLAYGINCGGLVSISCSESYLVIEDKFFFRTIIGGSLDFGAAKTNGAIVISGVQIQGDLQFWGLQSKAFLRIHEQRENRTEINGKLNLAISETKHMEFGAIRVRGDTNLSGVQTGSVDFSPARLSKYDKFEPSKDVIVLCELGSLNIKNAVISGDLSLSHLQVRGSKIVSGRQGLYIENTTIKGMLEFFKIGAFRDIYQNLRDNNTITEEQFANLELPIKSSEFSAGIFGNLGIKKCNIKGDCDLSFIKVSKKIDLEDTFFGGDLKFSSTLTFLGPDANPILIKNLRDIDDPLFYQYRAICSKLDMRMVKCANDIDMTGLSVFTANNVSINARYISVAGDLKAYTKKEEKESYIVSPGEMNLSYSKISRLVISGHSFPYFSSKQVKEGVELDKYNNGLVLERSEIGLLDIRDKGEDNEFKYPMPIRLTNIKVDAWKIADKEEEKVNSERFIKLLKYDVPFRRSTYRTIERSLRNSGHDDEADKLYIEMMNRAWLTERKGIISFPCIYHDSEKKINSLFHPLHFLQQITRFIFSIIKILISCIFHILFKYLLKYGTSPIPLILIALFLVLISLPAYWAPENFETSLEYLANGVVP